MSVNLLVIDYDSSHNWYEAFRGQTVRVNGVDCTINVEQTAFEHISLSASADTAVLDIASSPDPIFGSTQKYVRRFQPDFCLIRNVARGVHLRDYRNILYGLHYAGVGSVNSLSAIISCQERAVVYAELNKLRRTMGDAFPFIPATYHSNLDDALNISPVQFPSVVKVGTSCAGYGKLKADDAIAFRDIRTTLSMVNEYFTVESFQNCVCDVRVQKIGTRVRAFTRSSDSWKGNMGNTTPYNEIEVSPLFQGAALAAGGLFGGLDILSVDFLQLEDGRFVILEVNDTATGLNSLHYDEDVADIVGITVQRFEEHMTHSIKRQQEICRQFEDVSGSVIAVEEGPKKPLPFLGVLTGMAEAAARGQKVDEIANEVV